MTPLCAAGRVFDPAHPTCRSCTIGCVIKSEHDAPSVEMPTLDEIGKKHGLLGRRPKKQPKQKITLILPFKLPTWNQLLAMDHWQRARVRTWIKKQVLECIQNGEDSPTLTGSALKLSLTDSCKAEYSEMITPNSSKKLYSRKRLARTKKQ